eukprot:UN26265
MVIWSYLCGFDNCYHPLNWHILFLFAVYPIYGVVQQFLIQNMIASNLQSYKVNPIITVLITAIAFWNGTFHITYNASHINIFIWLGLYTVIFKV